MRLAEIMKSPLTEDSLAIRLKNFDWNYEYSDNLGRQRRGHQAMLTLENDLYALWKQSPEKVVELWNKHSPFGTGVTPSFIIRRQLEEEF